MGIQLNETVFKIFKTMLNPFQRGVAVYEFRCDAIEMFLHLIKLRENGDEVASILLCKSAELSAVSVSLTFNDSYGCHILSLCKLV